MSIPASRPTNDGFLIGQTISEGVGFHGVTPTPQPASAAQAAVATTAPTNSSPYGFSQAQATALIALTNEMRSVLVTKGLMKGAA